MAIATITAANPASVPANAGGTVTLTGVGYTGTTAVTINGAAASFVITNDTTLAVTTPNASSGPATVAVTNASGTLTDSTHLSVTAFVAPTYNAITQITGVFDTSFTTRFTNNTADQYAFENAPLFGGTYPTSYPKYLERAAKIKAVVLNNKRYPALAVAVPSF